MKISANIIKVGNILKHKEKLLEVLNTSIIKPGKGGAFIQVEMKDIQSGTKFNERWRTSDNVDKISVEVENAKKTFKKYNWPTIDVTRKSVEETAASVIKIYEISKENE